MNGSSPISGGLSPFQNTPFVDDWGWAWSVEHLLKTGRLEILDLSTSVNVAQVLWGSLFCLPFGFSFAALRVSTLVLAVGGLWALYLLLRELQASPSQALVGTAALAVNPVFALLSVTFMTDVPFVSFSLWAAFAMVRALRRQHVGWLLAAALFATLSTAVRLPGLATSLALLLALVAAPNGWGRRSGRWAIAMIPLVACVLLVWWSRSHTFHVADLTWVKNAPLDRVAMLRDYAPQLMPRMLIDTFALTCGTVGLALLPISLSCLRRDVVGPTLAIFALLVAPLVATRLAGVELALPLVTGSTWAANELGGMAALVPDFTGPLVPMEVGWLGLAIGTGSLACAAAASASPQKPWGRIFPMSGLSVWSPEIVFLDLMIVGHALLIACLWLIGDRYALILIPLFIALTLSMRPALSMRVAIPALAVFALITLAGMHDHFNYNRAVWEGVATLQASGVPEREINGGYVVNGWLQYAHPERAHRDAQGNVDVPWVNGSYDPPYRIANSVSEGWAVLRTIGYSRWLGRDGRIYVLRRNEGTENSF